MKDKRYKQMVRDLIRQLKKNEICVVQEIEGGEIDAKKISPCDKVLIIGMLVKT